MGLDHYLEIFVKLIVTLLLLLIYVRISGTSQLAPTTTFDQIGNILVGAIGGSTLLNTQVDILDSAVFMGLWILILLFIRFLRARSATVKELIDGKRVPLMIDGELQKDALERLNLTVGSIVTVLHKDNVISLHDVVNIWSEANGELTFDLRGDERMSLLLVENGLVVPEGLAMTGKDEAWLEDELGRQGYPSVSEVYGAEWVGGRLWVYN